MKKDLEKAQKEVKEGAIERERFQQQLEMLVQELEQKQVTIPVFVLLNPLHICNLTVNFRTFYEF